jgi:hypothetical protein
MHLVTLRPPGAGSDGGHGVSAVDPSGARGGDGAHGRGADAAPGGEGERSRDLLAGERVWEAAWGAWATARADAEELGAGRSR